MHQNFINFIRNLQNEFACLTFVTMYICKCTMDMLHFKYFKKPYARFFMVLENAGIHKPLRTTKMKSPSLSSVGI